MEPDRGILLSQGEDGEGRPSIGGLRHPGQELCETSIHQSGDLFRQHRFQRNTPTVRLVVLPGKFMWAVAAERTAVFYHDLPPPA